MNEKSKHKIKLVKMDVCERELFFILQTIFVQTIDKLMEAKSSQIFSVRDNISVDFCIVNKILMNKLFYHS